MYGKPTKTPGSVAILSIDRLFQRFMLEGHLDHLLEIGKCLDADEVAELARLIRTMDDAELESWVGWLLQVGPAAAAHLITTYLL